MEGSGSGIEARPAAAAAAAKALLLAPAAEAPLPDGDTTPVFPGDADPGGQFGKIPGGSKDRKLFGGIPATAPGFLLAGTG